MDEKRKISLERAEELRDSIGNFLEFKQKFMEEMEQKRNIQRKDHKQAILDYFHADENDWNDWKWQIRNRISSEEILGQFLQLSEEEKDTIRNISHKYRWTTTPYYLSLMDFHNQNYPINKMAVPSVFENDESGKLDPMKEEYTNPASCITRRYPNRLIINVTSSCPMFCRHCQRRRRIGEVDQHAKWEDVEAALEYIRQNKEIRDVLITGGDPLTLSDEFLEKVISGVYHIPHVEIIRIGTRVPVTMPQRITDDLVNMLKKYHPLFVNVQFNHPGEITEESSAACNKLADAGIPLGNQMVFLRGINDNKYVVQLLNEELLQVRVRPYYIFHPKQVIGTKHFQITVDEGLRIMKYLRGHTSGLAIPQYILNSPEGLGKVPLLPKYITESDETHVKLKTWEGKEVCIYY